MKIWDRGVVALAVGGAKLGCDALVQIVERGLEVLLPAHNGCHRVVTGAEPRGHLRQRRSGLRLMGTLGCLEGLVAGGAVGPSIRDMPDRVHQRSVEFGEALELRII